MTEGDALEMEGRYDRAYRELNEYEEEYYPDDGDFYYDEHNEYDGVRPFDWERDLDEF